MCVEFPNEIILSGEGGGGGGDMDELTTHQVVSDCDLRRVIIPDTVFELCKVAYVCE